ncbi:NEAT domain-containing protein [Hathewaya massiliensis]|uniref:NEAT domain-containing protein n=1 Tax=Hathewaya massiliensis TaxID=1964382 RepID=UPI00115BFC45|nr:NEAT domain-containing protein [Hathewaya massiliensis]
MRKKIFKVLSVIALSSCVTLSSAQAFAKGIKKEDIKVYASATGVKNSKLEDGKYNVGIETFKENAEELSMAGQYVNKKVDLEVKNNKKYATLKITRMDWMKNIKISINNNSVNYETVQKDKEGKVASIRFEVPDLNTNVKFKMNVVPMGNAEVKFRVVFNDNITKLSSNSSQNKPSKNNKTKNNEIKAANNADKNNTVKKDNTNNTSEKVEVKGDTAKEDTLPQTGSPITTKTLSIIGGLAVTLGLGLKSRKKA